MKKWPLAVVLAEEETQAEAVAPGDEYCHAAIYLSIKGSSNLIKK